MLYRDWKRRGRTGGDGKVVVLDLGVLLLLFRLLISAFPVVGGVGGSSVDGYPDDGSRCGRIVTRETIQVSATASKLVEIHVRHNVPVSIGPTTQPSHLQFAP